jgi:hypothetical protein
MVPPFFVLYILILYSQNYYHYVIAPAYNFGYKPVTGPEIAKGLFTGGEAPPNFAPLLAEKKTKRRAHKSTQKLRRLNNYEEDEAECDADLENLDHREFPFSEGDAYPKFGVEDALAPSSKKAAGMMGLSYMFLFLSHCTPTNITFSCPRW